MEGRANRVVLMPLAGFSYFLLVSHLLAAFGLTGTLCSEKGAYAFFDGTSSAYRKVLKPEETIAGYKVAEIEAAAHAAGRKPRAKDFEPATYSLGLLGCSISAARSQKETDAAYWDGLLDELSVQLRLI